MYELITKDSWEFSVDIEKTKEYYRTYSDLCDCDACKNFYQVIRSYSVEYSAELINFLAQFGVDIEKPIETEWFVIDKQSKTIDYTAYYAVYGSAAKGSYEIDFGTINVVVQPSKNSPNTEMPEPYFVFQIFNLLLPWVLSDNVEELNDPPKKKRNSMKDKFTISKYFTIAGFLLWAIPSTLAILIYAGVLNKNESLPYLYVCLALAQILNGIDMCIHGQKKRGVLFFITAVITFVLYFLIP